MRNKVVIAAAGLLAWSLVLGCAGQTTQLQMKDGTGTAKEVAFPKGRLFGGVSQEQVGTLARMVADSNTAAAQRLDGLGRTTGETAAAAGRIEEQTTRIAAATGKFDETAQQLREGEKRLEEATRSIDATTRKISDSTGRIEETTRRIDETSQKSLDLDAKNFNNTQAILQAFEKVSKKQGTGEITIFFPVASSRIERGSLQYTRIVNFVDFLGRESRGRKIMLVSVGSASAFGPTALNERLARERAEAPLAIVDQYLVNTPHEYVKIYGTGDVYSPKGVARTEHQRYQAARLIAFFEKGQEPALPPEPMTERISQR